jgi:SAM domain (Sterile alpha motif)
MCPLFYLLRRWLRQFHFRYPQGRNLAGQVGLFPKTHIHPARPRTEPSRAVVPATMPLSSVLADKAQPSTMPIPSIKQPRLQPVQEGTDTDAAPNQATASGIDELIRATMTSARQKFVEEAKAVEKQAAGGMTDGRVTLRSIAPPIDVELGNDSGNEGDGVFGESSSNGHNRRHPHISEEEANITAPHHQVDQKIAYSPSERCIMVPLPESGIIEDSGNEPTVATAAQPLFSKNEMVRTSENHNSLPSPVLSGLRGISDRVSANHPSSAPLVFPSGTQTLGLQDVVNIRSIPSPSPSGYGHRNASRSSVATSAFITDSSLFSASYSSTRSADLVYKKPRGVDPVEPNDAVEWNVEEVVDWLRAKGFDDMVCNKFIEQEVRGDVLLELDVGVLKSELGIVEYGTHIRIMDAISELRRPSSVLSYEPPARPRSPFRVSSLGRQAYSSATSLSTVFRIPASPESSSDLGELAEQLSEPPHEGSDTGGRPKGADDYLTVGLELGIPSSSFSGSDQGKAAVSVLLSSVE